MWRYGIFYKHKKYITWITSAVHTYYTKLFIIKVVQDFKYKTATDWDWMIYKFNPKVTKSKFWNVNEMGLVQKDISEWRPIWYDRARASSSEQASMADYKLGNKDEWWTLLLEILTSQLFIAVSSLVEAYINNFQEAREKKYEALCLKVQDVAANEIVYKFNLTFKVKS